jgi:replicative superfamily II helicase
MVIMSTFTLPSTPALTEELTCRMQAEALQQPGVLDGGNLVFTAPTSAGKSAVAEVLMLRQLVLFRDKVCSSPCCVLLLL